MPDEKIERRIKLKFLLKLEKSASENFRSLICEMCMPLCDQHEFLSGTHDFVGATTNVVDERKLIGLKKMTVKFQNINDIVRKYRRPSVRMIVETVRLINITVSE